MNLFFSFATYPELQNVLKSSSHTTVWPVWPSLSYDQDFITFYCLVDMNFIHTPVDHKTHFGSGVTSKSFPACMHDSSEATSVACINILLLSSQFLLLTSAKYTCEVIQTKIFLCVSAFIGPLLEALMRTQQRVSGCVFVCQWCVCVWTDSGLPQISSVLPLIARTWQEGSSYVISVADRKPHWNMHLHSALNYTDPYWCGGWLWFLWSEL